jgi:hypothetical protein
MALNARTLAPRTAAALWLAVTLYETLRIIGFGHPVPFWGFFAETMAGVDYAQNVVLFLPMGWIANRGRWSLWRTVVVGALISGGIEFAQQWIPGRTSQATDIICNAAGAALGWWMATPTHRPRIRVAIAFAALAGFMGLHQLNTAWPTPVDLAGGAGVWQTVDRVSCPAGTRQSAACIVVPNPAQGGSKYVRVVGAGDRTYARVQSHAVGRPLTRNDCVLLMFENTLGARLRLRPPLAGACGVADTSDQVILLRVDPRLEHEGQGAWTPTRAGVWMWPVWPFTAYQPMRLVAAGALGFVVLAALMMGTASWVIPAGYLVVLELVALVAEMRGPGWWELGWTVVGWAVAFGVVMLDRWWRSLGGLTGVSPGT